MADAREAERDEVDDFMYPSALPIILAHLAAAVER
jgi:hypothetical protein